MTHPMPLTLTDFALLDADARATAQRARHRLRQASLTAIATGTSEREAARQAGVTRATIRQWNGKDQ